jgi:hypothetical protein
MVIAQIPPYDGEYELDLDIAFSTFEWRWIKQIAGYKPLTIAQAFEDGDPDVFCALAVIAMNRAGKVTRENVLEVADVLAEAPFDGSRIQFKDEQEVEDESPPELTSEPEEASPNDSLENKSSSGPPLRNGLVRLAGTLEPISTTPSDTSSTSQTEIKSAS